MLSKVVVAVAVLAGCTASALGGDLVQKKDGSFNPAIKGAAPTAEDYEASNWQVLDANTETVLYQLNVGGKAMTQKLKSVEVLEICMEPRDYPGAWKEAVSLNSAGDYVNAARRFQEVGNDSRVNAVVRQKALLNAARAVASSGKTTEADTAYEALLKAFPTTFYTGAVWKERSQMWMDAGNEAKAKEAAERLLALPGVSDSDKLEAKFLLVTIDFRKASMAGDKAGIQKALDQFKALAQETAGKKDLAGVNALARIGQGNCLLDLGNAKEAKGLFEEITQAKGNEKPVDAAAFNGLGECWFRQNDKQGFDEARRCFLRTSLLYADGTSADQIAKALYYAGECFYRLQDSEKWNVHCRQELEDCRRRFPSSPWAKKASQLLPTVPK